MRALATRILRRPLLPVATRPLNLLPRAPIDLLLIIVMLVPRRLPPVALRVGVLGAQPEHALRVGGRAPRRHVADLHARHGTLCHAHPTLRCAVCSVLLVHESAGGR